MATRWQSSPSYLAICGWLSSDIISVYWIWMWEIRQESFALGLNVFDLKSDFHGQRCFFFFSHTHTFSTKTIYMNSRLHWTLPGVQEEPSLDCEDCSRLVTAPMSASEYCVSEITAKWEIFKCHPYPKHSYLSSENIYLKHFHFLGKQLCKYI